jgi:hypothetical protein
MAHPIKSFETLHAGDSLSQKRRNPVKGSEVVYKDETEHALINEHRIWMQDGSQYKLSEVQPKHQAIDVPLIWTPAFTTSHNKGYGREFALGAANLGIPVFAISPQQNLGRIGNMSKGSHDHIETAQYIARIRELNSRHFMTAGPSRGGDQALAMAGVAPAHEAEVVFFQSDAACMMNGLELSKLPEQAAMLKHEPKSLIRMVTKGPIGYRAVLLNTVATDPIEAFQQSKEVFTLTDGSVGRLTRKMPKKSFGVAKRFRYDGLAFNSSTPSVLDPFENVYQQEDEGSHFDCVSPEQLVESIGNIADVRDGIMSGAIGAAALHDMVAVGNPRFQRESDRHLSVVPA